MTEGDDGYFTLSLQETDCDETGGCAGRVRDLASPLLWVLHSFGLHVPPGGDKQSFSSTGRGSWGKGGFDFLVKET